MKGSKSKILFLDIDGVLNRTSFGVDTYTEFLPQHRSELVAADVPLFTDSINNLKKIVDNVRDLGIVWSTDWRFEERLTYDSCSTEIWQNPRLWLESQTWFRDALIGKTPKKRSSERHEEIHFWLFENELGKKNDGKDWLNAENTNHFIFMKDAWYDIDQFAILDDLGTREMSLYGRRFFCTQFDKGLDNSITNQIITMLNNVDKKYNKYCYSEIDWRKKTMKINNKTYMKANILNEQLANRIISLTLNDQKRLILNDEYICHLISYSKKSDCRFFSNWEKDSNCPRESCYAYVEVYARSKFQKSYGIINIEDDKDLVHRFSMSLYLFKSKKLMNCRAIDNIRKLHAWTSMITISNVQIAEMPMKLNNFMKLIKYKPEIKPKEPIESLGLGIVVFKCPNNQFASIEYSIEGSAYYEAINEKKYVEGDIIPNSKRYDVSKVKFLNSSNALKFANHINLSLDRIFFGKVVR